MLFKEGKAESTSQIHAFEDSWHWSTETQMAFEELVGLRPSQTEISQDISDLISGFEKIIGRNDVMAYLVMMTIRLLEMHRVLKESGSIYLHCDPTVSHYLKIVMDVIFGKTNFRNEIIWKRATTVKSNVGQGSKFWGPNIDTILFYTKANNYYFKQPFTEYSNDYIATAYRYTEPGTNRRYRLVSMIGPGGKAKGNPKYTVMGITRYWRYSKARMDELVSQGLVLQSRPGTVPNRKYYLDEGKGVPIQSLWDDIGNLQASDSERLGYPTQKPEKLLERIIQASCPENGVVLDPFCGCGTTVSVAERLNRNWVGIDITVLAINLIRRRLNERFAEKFKTQKISVEVDGLPNDMASAHALFEKDSFQFQYWVLDMLNAMPTRGKSREKPKGADQGIDGIIVFRDRLNGNEVVKTLIVSVKGGKNISVSEIRDLKGVVEREKAEGAVYVTMHEPKDTMLTEARLAGFFTNTLLGKEFPKIQILTVQDLLDGKRPALPTGGEIRNYNQEALPVVNNEPKGRQSTLGHHL